jgi:hypothetical protein
VHESKVPDYTEFIFLQIKAHAWRRVIGIQCLSYKIDAWLLDLRSCFSLVHIFVNRRALTPHSVQPCIKISSGATNS